MNKFLEEMIPEGDGVKFKFEKYYGKFNSSTPDPDYPDRKYDLWSNEFVIKPGEIFKAQPTHHSWGHYTLDKVEETGVVISYEKSFDHRSVGKNQINKSKGTIRLPWKKNE